MSFRKNRKSQSGYVALEFALGMGMLVLPTALILLQIPTYLEQHDRISSIAATVAHECANKASTIAQGQQIALNVARAEKDVSTSLSRANLVSATCSYETGTLIPGTKVTSNVTVLVPSAVVPGLPQEVDWTMSQSHETIIPKYRSVDEP